MSYNADYTREYFAIMESLQGDVPGRRAAYEYLQGSTAIVHHQVVAASFVPRLFDAQTYRIMKETAETAHRILVKVIEHYLADPAYRRAFDFDPRLEELILLPRGYDAVLPFARVDTFLDEDDGRIKFCEFNADGSSGMNENREITTSVAQSKTFEEFANRHHVEGCELFESWVDKFLDIYATYERRVENPCIAICDYLENGVVDEFHIYAGLFRQRGVECVVADAVSYTHLARAHARVHDGHRVAEAPAEAPHRLRRERYLGHEHARRAPRGERRLDGLQVHLGLARPGDAVHDHHLARPALPRRIDSRERRSLPRRQRRLGGRNERQSLRLNRTRRLA